MTQKIQVNTPNAPLPEGPYSQAIKVDGMLYISGQLGIDVTTGMLAPLVEEQAEFAMKNIGAILQSQGLTYDNLVKTTIYLNNFGEFYSVNQVYASFFEGTALPARSCVEIEQLPKSALVEIEAIACY